ncbi:MAG TPA: hypothetical protein VLG69_00615 [Candidatus Andersenbacteria bacterium]|nr:hypothetical protein [Candidatus Andersenbacteria bacterium]
MNNAILPYADAMSRMDIARKVVDNLNPGLAQLGNVWLPLPQLLMLPFIWNDYLWHSGLAGAFMSMTAFIIGGYYVYKSAYFLSKSFLPSFFSMCVFALNINAVYLQTTAMSESLFLCLLSISTYYFLRWVNKDEQKYLIFAGAGVAGITLIRYEGLALLLSSIGFVGFYSLVKYRSLKRIESNLIIYCWISCLGFALWTLYLAAIFGDPLFWLRYYASVQISLGGGGAPAAAAVQYSQAKPFLAAVWEYVTSITWMSGVIPVVFAFLGLVLALIVSIWKRSWNFLVLLLPLSIFFLMVLTLQRNTPIVQPSLNIPNLLSTQTSLGVGFNIRYGIMLLPWIAVLTVFVFNLKKPWYIPTLLFFAIFSFQIFNTFFPKVTAIYEIPRRIYGKPDSALVDWMRNNYDGGYIMISATGFEDQMFEMGLPYRTYIHEGAGKYWTEALDRPARYANWIVIDMNRSSDVLAKEFVHKQYWNWDYNIAWKDPGSSVTVYKIKTKPDIIIPKE